VNSLPKTVTRQRQDCDLNPGPSASKSSTVTTRLPSHSTVYLLVQQVVWCYQLSMDESPRPCQPNWPTSALLVQQQQVGGSQVVVAPVRELLLHFLPRPAVVHRHLRHSVVVQDVPLHSTATPSTYQTWNWVIGSPFTSWSPGHHFDPVRDASFSGFRKKAQDKDIYFW